MKTMKLSEASRSLAEYATKLRFLTQFGSGFGDYTRERDTIFRSLTMDEILSEIRRTQRRRPKRLQPTRKKRARG